MASRNIGDVFSKEFVGGGRAASRENAMPTSSPTLSNGDMELGVSKQPQVAAASKTSGSQDAIDSSMTRLKGLVSGSDPFSEMMLGRFTTQNAASNAARRASERQKLAQSGLTGQQAFSSMAQTGRDAATAQQGGMATMATDLAKRADEAAGTLGNLGIQGRQLDQQQSQFDVEAKLKERGLDQVDLERTMRDEQFKVEARLKERGLDQVDADRLLKMDQFDREVELKNRGYDLEEIRDINSNLNDKARIELEGKRLGTEARNIDISAFNTLVETTDLTDPANLLAAQNAFKKAYPGQEAPSFDKLVKTQKSAKLAGLANEVNGMTVDSFGNTSLESIVSDDGIGFGETVPQGVIDKVAEYYKADTGKDLMVGDKFTTDGKFFMDNLNKNLKKSVANSSYNTLLNETATAYGKDSPEYKLMTEAGKAITMSMATGAKITWSKDASGNTVLYMNDKPYITGSSGKKVTPGGLEYSEVSVGDTSYAKASDGSVYAVGKDGAVGDKVTDKTVIDSVNKATVTPVGDTVDIGGTPFIKSDNVMTSNDGSTYVVGKDGTVSVVGEKASATSSVWKQAKEMKKSGIVEGTSLYFDKDKGTLHNVSMYDGENAEAIAKGAGSNYSPVSVPKTAKKGDAFIGDDGTLYKVEGGVAKKSDMPINSASIKGIIRNISPSQMASGPAMDAISKYLTDTIPDGDMMSKVRSLGLKPEEAKPLIDMFIDMNISTPPTGGGRVHKTGKNTYRLGGDTKDWINGNIGKTVTYDGKPYVLNGVNEKYGDKSSNVIVIVDPYTGVSKKVNISSLSARTAKPQTTTSSVGSSNKMGRKSSLKSKLVFDKM